jgi:CrcB protein
VTLLLVLLAGALGAASRYLVERAVTARVRREWPWGTFVVNVTGCFALGLLTGVTGTAHTVLGTGLVGAYTTFSAYAVEVVKVDADGSRAAAVGYGLGSVVCGVLAAGLGIALGG